MNIFYALQLMFTLLRLTVMNFVGTDRKYDVIFIDVDSKDLSQGLSSPPSSFVDSAFLQKLHSLISPRGNLSFVGIKYNSIEVDMLLILYYKKK